MGKRGSSSSSSASEGWRWLGLVTAVWVQSISGNNYTFANYSDALKTMMGLTQLQLNNLSVAKDVGKAFGLLAGVASDRLPSAALLTIGSLMGFLGYGAQWLVVSRTIDPLPYWQMCVLLCVGGNSTTWMNTAVLVTCIRNFRRSRGPVSGILKGYVGLSTAIFTDICNALFADDPAAFLLMLAVVPAAVCAAAGLVLKESSRNGEGGGETAESRTFTILNSIAVFIAVYLLAFDVSGQHGVLLSRVFAAGLIALLALPLGIPTYIFFFQSAPLPLPPPPLLQPLLDNDADVSQAPPPEPMTTRRGPRIGEEHTVWEATKAVEFWVLFLSFLLGVGTGLTVMNNMGQIGLAMGFTDVSLFVSLISIFGFFGRIASGTISEHFLRKCGTPRPLWNAASQMVMASGYGLLAAALPGSLHIGAAVVGTCYGVRLSVTVATASELFGLRHYGLLYNVLVLNLPLGSFIFSGLLAGFLYDAEATPLADGGNTCVGAHCYRLIFIVMAVTSAAGLALDLILAVRTRSLYATIYTARVLGNKS